MRSREQFKAYVYAKAEAEQAQGRKRRRLMFSGIAACSVCICVTPLKRPALRRVLSVCASAPWSRSSFRKT